ncbi:6401_t:CDS:2 [Diversispora eburnea]|uniref:6401_t:CDS:1 n=1 Tax=Diversispora eburnea TaxID=1213867 RepID=A0A9N9AK78_9GLOM|nr:6401_t:CDS:2 [Diversispora eburnea]
MQLLTLSLHSLTLAALGATIYLYYYTAFCGWKWKDSETRMLFLADPQIEGDSKVRKQGIRGEIDLIANDIFIRHVYTSFVSPYSLFTPKPTHSIILGDLFSSQWINDQEFERRVKRYKWIFGDPRGEYKHEFINLTGNHDIGYSRDITKHRVDRWEKEFGKMSFNRWIPSKEQILSTYNIDEDNKKYHRLAVINSMNIDEREQENYQTPLILLLHIPIFKKGGLCVDGPMTVVDEHEFIIEQNHLSYNASKFILTKLKPKFIFAGHDHEGCDITHVIHMNNDGDYSLEAYRTFDFEARKKESGYLDGKRTWVIREITVRSVMGEFGGNAGLFEIHKKRKDNGNEVRSKTKITNKK